MSSDKLTDFIEDVTGDSHLRVEDDLGDGFVRLRVSEAERRQARHDIRSSEDIVIEMLRNARDAGAHNIFVASHKVDNHRIIVIVDDGNGVPYTLRDRIFDARVTSKLDTVHMDAWGVHGRGMALYSIKINAQKAYVVDSLIKGGSSFFVETDTNTLSEKRDQSTKPFFSIDDTGVLTVRGPRNIYRTIAEMAYLDRDECTVYYGSPVDIASTLYAFGSSLVPSTQRVFGKDLSEIPLCKRLAFARSPESFVSIAHNLGLELSERSARRIIDQEIPSLNPVVDALTIHRQGEERTSKKSRNQAPRGDQRGFHLAQQDRDELIDKIRPLYRDLADRYYLDPAVDPEITTRADRLTITIPLRRLL